MRRSPALGVLGVAGALLALVAVGGASPFPARAAEREDLLEMDLEDLMDLEVTTASKRPTKVSETAAAVFVITREDILRSGVTTVPDALRMAPGIQVSQIDASRWAISARGFLDEFSNKLLVMIDGRSIYTPLFSGVIWNEHDLMLEDVERIEVVRGPGGTVWGANAVNGVIHIITRDAADTQGLLASALAGDPETFVGSARWGGSLGDDLHYRVYGRFRDRDAYASSVGAGDAHDAWESVRAGGRLDWQVTDADHLTLQGDFLDSEADRTLALGSNARSDATGGNVLARWSHTFSQSSDLSLQLYYDSIVRDSVVIEDRDTLDVDLQHAFRPFARNEVTWGAGYRLSADRIRETPIFSVDGKRQQDHLYSLFLQDRIALVPDLLSLTVGSKLEHNDYTGFEVQPSARAVLTPHERHSVWAAVSRAVRTPSRSEEDLAFPIPISPTLVSSFRGSSAFDSEEVIAYELGYRTQPVDRFTFDVAGFYNDYDDLLSVVVTGQQMIGPVLVVETTNGNGVEAEGYGVELAATWRAHDRLTLTGAYTFNRIDVQSATLIDLATLLENLTPRHRFRIASHVALPWDLSLDASLEWVSRLPRAGPSVPAVDAYTRLDLRLAWRPVEGLELSVAGRNLIEEHREFPTASFTRTSEIPRGVYGQVRWEL